MKSILSVRPAWAEINLDHIAHNIRLFRKQIGSVTEIIAVVKADGYGHGARRVAEMAINAGASCLAVAFVDEAVDLRKAGIKAKILILGYTDPSLFKKLVEYNLTPTIFGLDTAEQLSWQAQELNIVLPVHIKVDTGMGRVGLLPEEALEVITRISILEGLSLEGIFTHLASAEDNDFTYTTEQMLLFNRIIDSCQERGISFSLVHAANSAAALNHPSSRFNMIRLGLSMYGHYPASEMRDIEPNLKPSLSFKSRVILVKKVQAGKAIGYGCTYHTSRESLIATIPVGYADGYSRLLSNKGQVLIRSCRVPVVGTICMDQMMVDVTDVPGVRLGDEVVLYGKQGQEEIKVEEAAELIGTINYELLCAVSKRVPRYYFKNNKLASIYDIFDGELVPSEN
ncbi:MAG: alanine racemase [Bacillota bacterium]